MIWFLTPHWKTDRWVRLQAERIRKSGCNKSNSSILATVAKDTGVYSEWFTNSWYYEPVFMFGRHGFPNHWMKLDFLFMKATCMGARDNDITIFLDGDAFPLGPEFPARIARILRDRYRYCFIREPAEEKPHCAFFASKLKDWRGLSWFPGPYKMKGSEGELVKRDIDIGGPLESRINHSASYVLERTTCPEHPEFFSTFGDSDGPIVYHHGASFRKYTYSRAERAAGAKKEQMRKNDQTSLNVFRRLCLGEDFW